ncbi:non-specific lipid transfer protein GPI-anchored 5-like isoform X2 [Lycium ferocissimum]|uniref:non-specific lipid transfer protein GPI-anchored 5-like isoform X2 n=1 Tax=Lycium ferocissimum TaxID=112874 RepID=UPI002814F914|nr:non-specific lipid transfer protein GPI-anchored 5-like isoform X2 [Lycium ferocissimum]
MQISASLISAIFVAVAFLSLHVSAQSDCQQVIVGLAPCLQYIEGNATSPSSGCCTQLATIVKTRQQCVCEVFSGVNVNQTLALALPKACNVRTPSVSLCKGDGSRYSQSGDSSRGYSLKLPYSLFLSLVASLSYTTMLSTTL